MPSQSGQQQGLGPDPHLHTHVVIANMTQREDGAWRGAEVLDLYRSQAFGTAVYRAALARAAQRLGYGITLTGHRGEWELSGYERSHIEAFSQRRQDITQHMVTHGVMGAAAAQIAAHQSRLTKDHRSEIEMRQEWQTRASRLGLTLGQRTREAQEHGPMPIEADTIRQSMRTAVTFAHKHITERDAVMQVRTLETTALQRGMGNIVLTEARTEIHAQEDHGTLRLVTEGPWAGKGYTTQEMVDLERENLTLMQASQGQAQPLVETRRVEAWAQQNGLFPDQAAVVRQTLTSRHWLSAIEGKAGATKTTTIGAMRKLLEATGHTVRGFGPTTGSVRALREAGIESTTVASLLARSLEPGQATGEVWMVDESSLLATRQVHTLLHRARAAQVARVIFVGDQRQHGAIEAGRPIAQLQQAGMETAQLDIIRRQRDPELRQAVELAAKGETTPAVNLLLAQGRVTEIETTEERVTAIAQEYVRSVAAGQQVLVVSPANAERTALNAAIRTALQERGHLPETGIVHPVLINRSVTGAERGWARSYTVNDVVRYRTGSKKYHLAPGSYARVTAVDPERNQLTVHTDSGAAHTYAPAKLQGVEVYREETRQFAVGDRIQFRAPLKAQQIPNGAFGTIAAIDQESGEVAITLDTRTSLSTTLAKLRHIDYGYATTSHSSQGATIDRVFINVDTEHSVALVNQQQFYVSLSRARDEAHVFTNSKDELAQAVSRVWPKSTALDAVTPSDGGPRYTPRPDMGPRRGGPLQERQRQTQTELRTEAVPITVNDREYPARTTQQQPSPDTAQRVSYRQAEWRRDQHHAIREQAMRRAPVERQSERPTPAQEDTPKHQPERSRGIRYRL